MPEKYFKTIKQLIDQLAVKYGFTNYIREEKVFNEWELIVGSALAKHCTPKCIEQGVLFIEVKNNFWKDVIRAKQEEILNLIKNNSNNKYIKKIKII